MRSRESASSVSDGRRPPRPPVPCRRCAERPRRTSDDLARIIAAVVARSRQIERGVDGGAAPFVHRPACDPAFDTEPLRRRRDGAATAPPIADAPTAPASHADRAPLVFAIDDPARKILFRGGPELSGGSYALIKALSTEHREDVDAGRSLAAFRFVRAAKLADRLDIDEPNLRQRIARARRALHAQFTERCGEAIADDAVIENDPWHGYRLNPRLLRASPMQVRDA